MATSMIWWITKRDYYASARHTGYSEYETLWFWNRMFAEAHRLGMAYCYMGPNRPGHELDCIYVVVSIATWRRQQPRRRFGR